MGGCVWMVYRQPSATPGGIMKCMSNGGRDDFEEISAQRINIREPDGRLRCVIANTDRLPGLIMRGEEHPHRRPSAMPTRQNLPCISVILSRWRT